MRKRGIFVVLSGPSGAGKNTVLNAVLPLVPDIRYSVSATTRPPRVGEKEGVDYFFVDNETFDKMIENNELIEWAEFSGNRYGTPRKFIEDCLARGEIVISDLDIQGARQIKQNYDDAVFVFLLPPSMPELRRRLTQRGTEGEEAISQRLKIADDEIRAIVDYEYWIMNDSVETARDDLIAIIRAERRRVERLDLTSIGFDCLKRGVFL